ncbi:MAG: PLP-dependent aminotransferase family protein [Steroidobacteraceae bacterium]|jgi:GntR family transcriptional regulator / MocR family aminotransferase
MEPLLQLEIALPPRGSRSILASLHNQLRSAILDGRLKPGVRLPATRAWGPLYGVSRNTAVAAYDLLLSEGYVTARRGSGTVVARSLPRPTEPRGPIRHPGARRRLNPYYLARPPLAASRAPSLKAGAPSPIAFQVGIPDLASFPFDAWRRLSNRTMRRFRSRPPLTADPQGEAPLRAAIAQHVSFARAVACNPEDIVVTAGAQQAFDLLARVLRTPGRTAVALENPGYPPLRAAFEAHGAEIAPVPVDAEGLIVDRIPARARLVCVTPSHQFPLGTAMSAQRRLALLELCQRRGAAIVEDDYDAEFRFVDRPLDALQTLDRAQCVFYVGTFSKSLLPDLRLGYIVAPPWALAALIAAKQLADGHSSVLAQSTLALMISEGRLTRHVRSMQRLYRRRRDVLLEGLRASLHRWLEPLPSVAGLHVAARIVTAAREASVIESAARRGLKVGGLARYYAGRPTLEGLVLGYGNADESAIREGLSRLREAMSPWEAAQS